MRRREFIALLGGAAAAPPGLPITALAQQKKIPRIGIIDNGPLWEPYRKGMHDAGYIEDRNVIYVYKAADGRPDRLAAAAAELVRLPVDVIATYGTPPSRAAKAATSTIPIVALAVGDPVAAGLVQSLAHPGGNITGNTLLSADLAPKRLQLIKEVIPTAARVALLWNPDNISNNAIAEQMRATAQAQGLSFEAAKARSPDDLEPAFTTMMQQRPDAVLVTSDPILQSHMQKIIALLFRYGLPSLFQTRDPVATGGLMSYGASFPELFRQGAFFTDKILRGSKPADIPVQTPQHFAMSINLKTAKAIGLKISEQVILRADEVIE